MKKYLPLSVDFYGTWHMLVGKITKIIKLKYALEYFNLKLMGLDLKDDYPIL